MFLFADNVTINEDPDPSIWQRIGFVIIFLALFGLVGAAISKVKNDFQRKIVQQLQLRKVKEQ